jgi:hypothetical protein
MINRIESHNCSPQTQISFGELAANEPHVLAKNIFDFVERFKKDGCVVVVCRLSGCKARFVDAVVDLVVLC